jgi:transposase
VEALSIASIHKSGTQSRKQLDKKTVDDIRSDIRDSNPVDPIVVFFDGESHWVGDGYHRLEAYLKEKRDLIYAEVRSGSKHAALRFNIEANASSIQTRWTNADKRNAVEMLLQSNGNPEITRKMAEEIAALAKCHSDTVYTIAKELREAARIPSKPTAPAQPPVAQAVASMLIHDDSSDGDKRKEEQQPKTSTKNEPAPVNGRRTAEKVERDKQIAELASQGLCQTGIAKHLGVSRSTVSYSFHRQKLTRETANPLIKVLTRVQLAASEFEGISDLLRDGTGAAAKWPAATREQKDEVIQYAKEAIGFLKNLINRLNKEAKE